MCDTISVAEWSSAVRSETASGRFIEREAFGKGEEENLRGVPEVEESGRELEEVKKSLEESGRVW